MTLLVFVEVVMRFGFNAGFMWTQELTLLISAWFVLFGASYGVKVGAHIGVDAAVKNLSPKNQRIVGVIAVALCFVYCVLFAYGSWVYLAKVYSIGIELEDMPIPKWAAHSILLIGMGLLFVRFAILMRRIIQGRASGFHLADEASKAIEDADAAKKVSGAPPPGTTGAAP